MKYTNKTEVLYENQQPISGREPYLFYVRPGVILNIKSYSGESHNLIDALFGFDIPFYKLKRGDVLSIQFCRNTLEPVVPWYRKLWERIGKKTK